MCRIEKEKAQAKAEADDLRGQIDHLSKGKVRIAEKKTVVPFATRNNWAVASPEFCSRGHGRVAHGFRSSW